MLDVLDDFEVDEIDEPANVFVFFQIDDGAENLVYWIPEDCIKISCFHFSKKPVLELHLSGVEMKMPHLSLDQSFDQQIVA